MASNEVATSDVEEHQKFDEMLKEYDPPSVEISEEEAFKLKFVVRTADQAQQMYLAGELTEEGLAKSVRLFGKPSNPSESFNRVDATYERKLPRWVFNPPEGIDRSLEERMELANEKHPYDPDAPMSLEYRSLYPDAAREWDKKHATEKESSG